MEEKVEAAEKAAEKGKNKELYDKLKMTSGEEKRQVAGVKAKDGVLKTDSQERLQTWGRTI